MNVEIVSVVLRIQFDGRLPKNLAKSLRCGGRNGRVLRIMPVITPGDFEALSRRFTYEKENESGARHYPFQLGRA
jgi:hypothetical protein